MKTPSLSILLGTVLSSALQAVVVNADFSRDIVNGTNPAPANPAPVLYTGTGPAPDAGTIWNDVTIPLAATGDQGANTINSPLTFSNLLSSTGSATSIDIELTSGFFRSFNGTATAAGNVTALQNDRVFANAGNLATMTVLGLDPAKQYDLYLIASGNFVTAFTVNAVSKVASGVAHDGTWSEGGEFVSFTGISPTAGGNIVVGIRDGLAPIDGFGAISGIQIVEIIPEPSVALLSSFALLAFARRRRKP
jgi:hypothetical protein